MTNGLEIRNLWVRYASGKAAVKGASFRCPRGSITTLIGANGAGKTSLIRGILGLASTEGQVSLDGQALGSMSLPDRARRVAYVPQRSKMSAPLDVESVVDQARFAHRPKMAGPNDKDRMAVHDALEIVELSAYRTAPFPELSYGQQQRVLLARALATEATTLLLDEPTAALDIYQALKLHQHLRQLRDQGYCIAMVLHNLNEVLQLADHVVLLQDGRVYRHGTAAEVIAGPPILEVYGVELHRTGGLAFGLPERVADES